MLLLILLIALGGFIYWQFGSRMGNILSFLKTSGGGGGGGILDNTAPTFSNIKTSPSAATSVVVTWTTSEPASSQVEYGTSTSYGSVVPATPMFDPTTGQSAGVVTHSVELTGLQNSTTYHFRVKSKDKAKNEGISADNTFTVQAPPEE